MTVALTETTFIANVEHKEYDLLRPRPFSAGGQRWPRRDLGVIASTVMNFSRWRAKKRQKIRKGLDKDAGICLISAGSYR
jgi:hypothetical protein